MLAFRLLLMAGLIISASAQAKWFLGTTVDWDTQNTYQADLTSEKIATTQVQIETAIGFKWKNNWQISATIHAEAVPQSTNTRLAGDFYFVNIGVYVDGLMLSYQGSSLGLQLGKINPGYGLSQNLPGLWSTDLVGDYDLSEQLGGLIEMPLGKQTVELVAFSSDTSELSRSWLTKQSRQTRADGGVGNTSAPKSFLLSLSGTVFEKVEYFLAHRHLAQGSANVGPAFSDENSILLSLIYPFSHSNLNWQALAEFAHFKDYGGAAGEDRDYTTIALSAGAKNGLSGILSYTQRQIDYPINGKSKSHLAQFTLEKLLGKQWSIEGGYLYQDNGGNASQAIGIGLNYALGINNG